MKMIKRRSVIPLIVILLIAVILCACDEGDYPPPPTPLQSSTPLPTVLPTQTVGPLSTIKIDKLGLSLLAPSSWKAPVPLTDSADEIRYVMSPDGSTDTTYIAPVFMLVIVGNISYFHDKLSFPLGISDPVAQLKALVNAINRSAFDMGIVQPYTAAKYPGATVTYLERDNQSTITLLKVDADHWIYIGVQSRQVYFAYYRDNVFKPSIDSMLVNPS